MTATPCCSEKHTTWLATKLTQERLCDEAFMNSVLHGFTRFVQIRLGMTLVDCRPRKVKLAAN